MLPDACILADFALHRLARMVDGLVVYPEQMRRNLDATHGLYSSQRVLLALTEAGLPRQRAYELVQRACDAGVARGPAAARAAGAGPRGHRPARRGAARASCSTWTTIWPMST